MKPRDGKRERKHQISLTPGNNSKANQLSTPQSSYKDIISLLIRFTTKCYSLLSAPYDANFQP